MIASPGPRQLPETPCRPEHPGEPGRRRAAQPSCWCAVAGMAQQRCCDAGPARSKCSTPTHHRHQPVVRLCQQGWPRLLHGRPFFDHRLEGRTRTPPSLGRTFARMAWRSFCAAGPAQSGAWGCCSGRPAPCGVPKADLRGLGLPLKLPWDVPPAGDLHSGLHGGRHCAAHGV